jgi:UDP-GlcNAc:undecaprenyl-phosphate GlcNAc-1-phosphate transferase
VDAAVTIAALPVAALVLWALLSSGAAGKLVAVPTGERWHERPTPTFGGVGIFAGLLAGLGLAVAVGAVEAGSELLGIAAGTTLLFAAGLIDDVRHLTPLAKLGAQIAAAVIVIAAGLNVELVGNDVLATAIALVWLVGITNAFNLLDNMDGLAATLAAIACGFFAIAAARDDPVNDLVLVLALALGFACLGFLPFNLRRNRDAAVFMGDSGSQVVGFTLASLGLASSWTVAGTTTATVLLPLLVLAIPILDTTLVTAVRLLERRPVTQGGKDHSSHRLVYYGLSERKAVALLALIAIAVGATGIAYAVLDNGRVTVVGVLVTMVLLVQFASFLGDLEQRARSGTSAASPSLLRGMLEPRRLAEIVLDFVLMCVSFLVSYALLVDGLGTTEQRDVFLAALPVTLAARYLCFVVAGVYRRVWRFAGMRDVLVIAVACGVSGLLALVVVDLTNGLLSFPWEVFPLDALLATVLVAGSRVLVGLALVARDDARSTDRRRVLVVGAGRSGRSLARELRETPGVRVVGFVDDNPGVRRRRIVGVTVAGGLDEIESIVATTRPNEVLVTIPSAPASRLTHVAEACRDAGVDCRFVRRTESEPLLEAQVE